MFLMSLLTPVGFCAFSAIHFPLWFISLSQANQLYCMSLVFYFLVSCRLIVVEKEVHEIKSCIRASFDSFMRIEEAKKKWGEGIYETVSALHKRVTELEKEPWQRD